MYREHLTLFKRLHVVGDVIVMALAFAAVVLVATSGWIIEAPTDLRAALWLMPTAALFWLFFLDANGLYYTYRTVRGIDLVGGVAKSILQGCVALVAVLFAFDVPVGRLLLVSYTLAAICLLTVERLIVRRVLARIRVTGKNYNSILLIGTGRGAQDLVRAMRRNAHWGLRAYGCLSTDRDEATREVDGVPVVGEVADFERILGSNPIDEVAIVQTELSAAELGRLLALCEREGIKARVIADLYRPAAARQVVEELDGLPVVTFAIGPGVGWQLLCKEVIDRVGALAFLLLLSPLFGLIALLVKLDGGGPVLFRQERVGLRKRPFDILKFRTMVDGAHHQRDELALLNEAPGPTFKMEQDPRVTRVGRILRRLSLDELPQLWNVLRGEMSFIGPRPPLPEEVAQYEGWQRRRLSMKPGISGLWQVAGRGRSIDFSEWVRMDLEYIDNWSLALDLRILVLTVPAVLFGRGAV